MKKLIANILMIILVLSVFTSLVNAAENVVNNVSNENSVNSVNTVEEEVTNSTNTTETEAKDLVENGFKYYINQYNEAVITGTTDTKATTLTIPNYVDNKKYQVTEIAERAFADNKVLEKVVFQDGVYIDVENEAFKGCSNLKEVVFPNDVDWLYLRNKSVFAGTAIETLRFKVGMGLYSTALEGMTNLKKIYVDMKDYVTTWFAEDYYQLDEATIKYLKENVTVYSYAIDEYEDNINNGSSLSPKGFADKHGIKFVDVSTLKQNVLTNNEKEVSVSVNASEGAKLLVDEIDKNSDFYKELASDFDKYDIQLAYDISVEGDYEGNIKVSLPVDSKYNGKVVTVLHYKADGTLERFTCMVVNEKVEVEVSELSPFVVIANPDTANQNQSLDGVPKTGDNNTILIVSILSVITLGAIIIEIKK